MAPTKFNEKLRQAKAEGKLPKEFASVVKMNSPAKMGSAYKMDKSAFKLKSAPVNMNTPGSVAKLAGVSPMKNKNAVQNLAKVDPKLRDAAYYAKVKEVTGSDKVKSGGKIY